MTDVIMPQMGESIAEGTITKWMKQLGERVERDEALFEISTDKVDAEIPAPAAGVLREIRVPAGETVPVNSVVAVIDEAADQSAAPEPPVAAAPTSEPEPPAREAEPVRSVFLHPSLADASPTQTLPLNLRHLAPPPPPAEPEILAASIAPPVTAPTAAEPEAGTPPAEPEAGTPSAAQEGAEPSSSDAATADDDEARLEELRRSRSSPVVRRIAAKYGVDLAQVQGTGISGRVTKRDIIAYLESRGETPSEDASEDATGAVTAPEPSPDAKTEPTPASAAAPPPPVVAKPPAPPAFRPGERVEVVKMSPIRRKTAEHMVLSKRTSAHVTTVFEVDMTRVESLRRAHGKDYEERKGVKRTYLPFILKASVDALKAFPLLNSSVDGESIVYKKDINLGVAVALDWGLIVPVIHRADEKNILGLARAATDLAHRARSKQLKVEEVQGATFTVTNSGVFGSLFGTPIISQPQVAILAVGVIERRPVVRDDAIAIRTMTYLALSFDHRIVDGSDADRFMAHVKAGLEEFDESAL